ncbi:MAG: phosphatase PAP2 family protein [Rhodoglobus sp.]
MNDDSTAKAPAPIRIARRWPLVSAGAAIALVIALGAVIVYRENRKPFGFEIEWMGEIVEHRSAFWNVPAFAFNYLGGGILAIAVVPGVIIIGLLVWRRPWATLYFAIAVMSSGLVVQILKVLIDRPRPTDILVHVDFGSFPSGHSANAAVVAATMVVIFRKVWVAVVGSIYTIGMMLSRTYLGAHWISDTVGGLMVGAGVAVILWAPFAYRLYKEQRLPHRPIWRPRTAEAPLP